MNQPTPATRKPIDLGDRMKDVATLCKAIGEHHGLDRKPDALGLLTSRRERQSARMRDDLVALIRELKFAWDVIGDLWRKNRVLEAELAELRARNGIVLATAADLQALRKGT